MHKLKLSHLKLFRTRRSDKQDGGTGRRQSNTVVNAESRPSTGPFAGASNISMEDSQINVIGGDMLYVTNITNVKYASAELHSYSDLEILEALRRLPDPIGFSWNASRVCSPGTRTLHIQEVSIWEETSSSAAVYVAADSAGSGKSALAHSISQKAHREGKLVASFFFDQMKHQSSASGFMAALIRGLCNVSETIRRRIGEILARDDTLADADPVRQFEEIILPVCPILPQGRQFIIAIDALDEVHDPIVVTFLRDWVPRLPPSFRIFLTTRPEAHIMEHLEKQPHIRQSSHSLTGLANRSDLELFIKDWFSKTKYGASISPKLFDAFVAKSEGLFLWTTTVLHHIDDAYDQVGELEDIIAGGSDDWKEADGAVKQLDSLYQRILLKLRWTDRRFVEKYRIIMGALVTLVEPLSATGLAALYEPDGITLDDIHRICGMLRPLLRDYSADDSQRPIHLVHLSVQEYLTQRAPLPYRIICEEQHSTLLRLTLYTIKNHLTSENVPILGYTDGDWFGDVTSYPPAIPTLSKRDVLEPVWYSCQHLETHTSSVPSTNDEQLHAELALHVLVTDPRPILEFTASTGRVIQIVPLRKLALSLSHSPLDPVSSRKTAAAYSALSRSLLRMNRHAQALPLIEDAVNHYRELGSDAVGIQTIGREFAVALHTLSSTFHHLGSFQKAHQVALEGLDLVRPLAVVQPTDFQPLLSKLLRTCSMVLLELGQQDNALKMALEDTQITRQLAADNAAKFQDDLATSLFNIHDIYSALKCPDDAIPPAVEAVQIYRRLALEDPARFNVVLSDYLDRYSKTLFKLGKHEEALDPAQESVSIRKILAADDPDAFEHVLAMGLSRLSYVLFHCRRHSDGVSAALDAVILGRRLAAKDKQFEDQLASSLHVLGAGLAKNYQFAEGIEPTNEAVSIRRRRILETGTSIYKEEALVDSLYNLAYLLGTFKRYEDAASHMVETIAILRRLVTKDPIKYEGLLSDCLFRYSANMTGLNRHIDAVDAMREALEFRRNVAARKGDPAAFTDEDLSRSLAKLANSSGQLNRYDEAVSLCREAIEIDRGLVATHEKFREQLALSLRDSGWYLWNAGQYVEAIENIQETVSIYRQLAACGQEGAQESLSRSLYDLGCHLGARERYDQALPYSSESIAIRRDLVAKNPAVHEDDLSEYLQGHSVYLSHTGKHVEALEAAQEAVGIHRRLALKEPDAFEEGLASSLSTLADCLESRKCSDDGNAILSHRREVIEIHRRLASKDPATYQSMLVTSLQLYGYRLSRAGQGERAVEALQEAVTIQRHLAKQESSSFKESDLALSLNGYAWYLTQTTPNSYPDAVLHAEEAAAIYRRSVAKDPDNVDLCQNFLALIDTLVHALNLCQRYDDAIKAVKEGLAICQQKAEVEPLANSFDFPANVLHQRYSEALFNIGRDDEALTHTEEAVVLNRRLIASGDSTSEREEELEECLALLKKIKSRLDPLV
ncbi:hypothetical protein FA15DRAFT_668470 [Coprinopsis marcescibilis]|uniref:Nephrocystin 3-like N-terminal domain-containing protein n=1 Tax=Coprinopsis marcescibilis TaxID=230819 RepID=A0A5C3KZY1_COPMA|nr:hypothetical protein FA15DRAFT_668470 [Coprinopsis marcescibilis]